MNQEYLEDKEITLKPISGARRLAEALLFITGLLVIYLLISLFSFDPADPSWSQTAWQGQVQNYGGKAGAWIADTLLFVFGVIAYGIPLLLLMLVLILFRQSNQGGYTDFFMLGLRIIGLLALIVTSCGLSAYNIDDIYYFSSGGVIGSLLVNSMYPWFSPLAATLLMLGVWAVGITLFTGWSWLTIAEKLGALVLDSLTFFTNRSRQSAKQREDSWYEQQQRDQPPESLMLGWEITEEIAAKEDPLFSRTPTVDVVVEEDLPRFSAQPNGQQADSPDNKTAPRRPQVIMPAPRLSVPPQEPHRTEDPLLHTAADKVQQRQQTSTVQQQIHNNSVKNEAVKESYSTAERVKSQGLDHPFLTRNEQPLPTPTTPLPTLELLTIPPEQEAPVEVEELEQIATLIELRLADYRVKVQVVAITPGPVITRFELELAPGVKAARISSLSSDLARSLSVVAVRIVEVIPGKPYVGLELPNKKRQTVYLREVLDCERFRAMQSPLGVVLGKDINGYPVVADLAKMPHLLVAGTTGSGKSVGINTMIISILYKAKPEQVKFIMIDPKMLELSVYEGIPHLLAEVVTDMKDAAKALRWCVKEMEVRYKLMSELGVRNLAGYNEKIEQAAAMDHPIPDPLWKPGDSMQGERPILEKLPYIVVMVDEFADLIMAEGKKIEELIARLAQKARAAGIHLVLATQRPSVDVITGLIKANVPTRIAFTVSSKIDSRTILDQGGAESLLGMGDMLYLPPNSSLPVRVHGAFVRDDEVHAVAQDWRARGRPNYIDDMLIDDEGEEAESAESDEALDPLFDQAVEFVVERQRVSISLIQRQFRIGYNRAARIVEQMELEGTISEPGHNGAREVLAR